MKISKEKIVRLMVLIGFTLTVGTLLAHELIMDSAFWEGRHPPWIDWTLPVGIGLLAGGTLGALVTKGSLIVWAFVFAVIALLASMLIPTLIMPDTVRRTALRSRALRCVPREKCWSSVSLKFAFRNSRNASAR
jgi:hypothetical protein